MHIQINTYQRNIQKMKCIWFIVSKQVFSINAVGSVGKSEKYLKQDEIRHIHKYHYLQIL